MEDVGHADKEFISKLNKLLEPYALLEDPDIDGVDADVSGDSESKVEAKDMNMGLLAIVVYGAFDESPVLAPNPKSICMAPSVAVG